jgi:short-subunit dehydrogenase
VRLAGAVCVVTGASSGIGAAACAALAARDARVVPVGRDERRLARGAGGTGGQVVVADLADPAQVRTLAASLLADGAPDVVVHNAGIGLLAGAGDEDADRLDELFAVNLHAPMQLTAALLPAMVARGSGHLVFVTSIAGVLGVARESAYAATKGALGAYAASLRAELSGTGVGVTTVVPGVVATEFFTRRGAAYARRFPTPMPAGRVADRMVRGIERDRSEVLVPRWLRTAVATRAIAPEIYARLAQRWG